MASDSQSTDEKKITADYAIDRALLWQEWAEMWAYAARSNQDDPVLEKQLWRRFLRFQKGCDRWKAVYNALKLAGELSSGRCARAKEKAPACTGARPYHGDTVARRSYAVPA